MRTTANHEAAGSDSRRRPARRSLRSGDDDERTRRAARRPARRPPRRRHSRPATARSSSCAGTAASAAVTPPTRSRSSSRWSRSSSQPPEHPSQVRGRDVRGRPRHACDPDRIRQSTRHRRPGRRRRRRGLPRPVARPRAAHRRPAMTSGSTPTQVEFYNTGGEARSASRSRSTPRLCYKASLFEEAGLNEPPHEYGDLHDARRHRGRLELRHHPRDRQAADGRRERQRRDPGRVRS